MSGRRAGYSWLAFIVLAIILLVVMQQCERQEVEIFVSPIPTPNYRLYVPYAPRNDNTGYWRVDFNNQTDLEWFGYELGYVRNQEPQVYTTTAVSIQNGYLVITGANYKSGSVFTHRAFNGGTFQIRAQFPESAGCWGALWLLGDDSCCQSGCTCVWSEGSSGGQWAANGELDVAENWHGWYAPAAHWGQWPNNQFVQGAGQWVSGWHTYKLVWLSDSVTFYIDDTQKLTLAHTYDDPMRLILNLAMDGNCNGQMKVDWVEWDA